MKEIKYIVGDATSPVGDGEKIIIHCCNDVGAWGAGFVIALSNKWPETKKRYRSWHRDGHEFELGNVQFVSVEDGVAVCNMIGQRNIRSSGGEAPIRYSAIRKCLKKVYESASLLDATIHCPRFGAGLAGGDWNQIEALLIEELAEKDIQVTVYDLQ